MTFVNFAFMLLGAFLLAGGVLVAALADRVRAILAQRSDRRDQASRAPRQTETRASRERREIAPSDTIFVPDEDPVATRRSDRLPRAKAPPIDDGMEADVVNALVAAGYNKRVARSAVQACAASERGSLSDWTRAALRRSREEVAS